MPWPDAPIKMYLFSKFSLAYTCLSTALQAKPSPFPYPKKISMFGLGSFYFCRENEFVGAIQQPNSLPKGIFFPYLNKFSG
ncbi:MAG: hypothetical protein ACKOW3_03205 [Hyphomicrobium sp.]